MKACWRSLRSSAETFCSLISAAIVATTLLDGRNVAGVARFAVVCGVVGVFEVEFLDILVVLVLGLFIFQPGNLAVAGDCVFEYVVVAFGDDVFSALVVGKRRVDRFERGLGQELLDVVAPSCADAIHRGICFSGLQVALEDDAVVVDDPVLATVLRVEPEILDLDIFGYCVRE
ncbi:hypothetical protein [Halovenus salina]|uniref:Uncharacterized protein n=1 Tax=Halovenus salina TaxID=1510225 RepID=A0ABD5VXS9_9EURY